MQVSFEGNRLQVSDTDGFQHVFSALWLRESSNSTDFRDPKTGHKLADGDQLPLEITITNADVTGGELSLGFSDGHETVYSVDELRSYVENPYKQEMIGKKYLWDASLDPRPWHSLHDLKADPAQILSALNDLARLGFILVKDMPNELDGMNEFIDLIGFIRKTNNGAIEDIKAIPAEKAYDLSMTPRALEPHTDNPYRVPHPGYILLHCLENTVEGGESGLTDGFRAAEELRKRNPVYFESLSTTLVNWSYSDDQAILEDTSTFIELNRNGSIKQVRFHGRCDRVAITDPDKLDIFYAARRMFIKLIRSDQLELRFKLQAGDMFLINNSRLIHSRKSFKLTTGARHMRQAYFDRDVVSSRQKTLHRDINSKPWADR